MSSPRSSTLPPAGFSRPASAWKSVVFPQPLRPTMQASSPSPTWTEIPSATAKSPHESVRLCASSAGAAMMPYPSRKSFVKPASGWKAFSTRPSSLSQR